MSITHHPSSFFMLQAKRPRRQVQLLVLVFFCVVGSETTMTSHVRRHGFFSITLKQP